MLESREFTLLLAFVLVLIVLEGDTRQVRLKEEKKGPPRDYRPSKWISNAAMDVWYGNKSVIDVFSREFNDVMARIATRPVRSVNDSVMLPELNATTISIEEQARQIMLTRLNETISKIIRNTKKLS